MPQNPISEIHESKVRDSRGRDFIWQRISFGPQSCCSGARHTNAHRMSALSVQKPAEDGHRKDLLGSWPLMEILLWYTQPCSLHPTCPGLEEQATLSSQGLLIFLSLRVIALQSCIPL